MRECMDDVSSPKQSLGLRRALFAPAGRELAAQLVSDAHASAAFLRHNVGQTVRDQTSGNFVLVPKPEHLSRETAPPPPSDVNP